MSKNKDATSGKPETVAPTVVRRRNGKAYGKPKKPSSREAKGIGGYSFNSLDRRAAQKGTTPFAQLTWVKEMVASKKRRSIVTKPQRSGSVDKMDRAQPALDKIRRLRERERTVAATAA